MANVAKDDATGGCAPTPHPAPPARRSARGCRGSNERPKAQPCVRGRCRMESLHVRLSRAQNDYGSREPPNDPTRAPPPTNMLEHKIHPPRYLTSYSCRLGLQDPPPPSQQCCLASGPSSNHKLLSQCTVWPTLPTGGRGPTHQDGKHEVKFCGGLTGCMAPLGSPRWHAARPAVSAAGR